MIECIDHRLPTSSSFRSVSSRVRSLGYVVKRTVGEGNCLYRSNRVLEVMCRACARQLLHNEESHEKLREEVTAYLVEHRAEIESYLNDKLSEEVGKDGVFDK